jgi:hypothetical protein
MLKMKKCYRSILHKIINEMLTGYWVGHISRRRNCLIKHVMEGKVE